MNERRKVLVAQYRIHALAAPRLKRLRAAGFDVTTNRLGRPYTEDELAQALPGHFAVIAGTEPYTARVLAAAKGLGVIARWGVDHDRVDVAAATRHRVAVAMAFGADHEAVADLAFAFMGGLALELKTSHERVVSGAWKIGFHTSLWDSTVGIVGLGRVGRALARRCKAFEMRILGFETHPDAERAKRHGIELVPLETLLRESDFVSLHAPHATETENLIDRDRLAWMKPTAFLINTAHGGLVDEDALFEALSAGVIAGAALDVFRREPPTDSPLLELEDNVLFSPHWGSRTGGADALAAGRCVENVVAVARGEDPGGGCVVNPEVLAAPRRRPQ